MGRSRSASWVETIRLPLGLRMVIGWRVGRLLRTGASMVPKLAVLPVSAMASWWWIVPVGGPIAIGASNVDANKQVKVDDECFSLLSLFAVAISFPPCQLLVGAPGRLGLLPMMVLLPPILMSTVAVS